MGLKQIFNIRPIATLMVLCILMGANISSRAQAKDTTIASITTAVDSDSASKANTTVLSPASTPLISTDVDTTKYAYSQIKPEVDHTPVYKSAAYYVLLFFLLCVFIGIIGKVLRVYELSREMQDKKAAIQWGKLQGVLFIIALVVGLYGVYWSYTVHGGMSIMGAASEHGKKIDFMFNITVIITTIVFILTHIFLFGFSFKYRGSENRKAYFYPHNNAIERLWTIVPAIVLTVLVLIGFFTWRGITNPSEEDQKRALHIEVRGEQFKWNIRYAGEDNEIGLSNYKLISPTNGLGIDFKDRKSWDDKLAGEIVLPVNRPVRVMIGSKDVLHSFYIPDFRVQMNAVPGMPTYFQFTPDMTTAQIREKRNDPNYDYTLLCAKICGAGHYNMQAKVRVVSEQEYNEWIAKQPLLYTDEVKKELQMADNKQAAEHDKVALNTNINR
ncbi:MAG TPA: cytochrome c oxidase subunit II transmembrane domain-containing protein [Daejeonella sp.]|nr:cytochrome c oxidase subunit II transmembrane domain-containing protein [Daejeonella sp.]